MIGNLTLHRTSAFLACAAALALVPSYARAAATATVTEITTFTTATGLAADEGFQLKDAAGNYYGTTPNGGTFDDGTIYKFVPSGSGGTITVLKNFHQDNLATPPAMEGSSPKAIIFGADGNIYGICRGGGTNPNTPDGGGTFFKIATDGTGFVKLFNFDNQPEAGAGVQDFAGKFPSGIQQGSDGNFYVVTRDGGAPGNTGTFCRLTINPAGTAASRTQLFGFKSGNGPGNSPEAQMIKATDGNFYGLTNSGGATGGTGSFGTIYKATITGAVTTVHLFGGPNGSNYDPSFFLYPLIQGEDGALYGTSISGGVDSSSVGSVFRCTLDGQFTLLHFFTAADGGEEPRGGLVEASDGKLYGSTNVGYPKDPADLNKGPGSYFNVTLGGQFTTILKLTANLGTNKPKNPFGVLTEITPGTFIGVTGPGSGTDESLVKLVVSNSHQSFFTGEASLGGSTYYLGLADATQFGYYAYLADTHYVYHYDLGYEYAFDETNTDDGVYLYDFASSSYFYTSTQDFPFLYDFKLGTWLYYLKDPAPVAPHLYTHNPRRFYNFKTSSWITK